MNQEEISFFDVCDEIILDSEYNETIKESLNQINEEAFKRNISTYERIYEVFMDYKRLQLDTSEALN